MTAPERLPGKAVAAAMADTFDPADTDGPDDTSSMPADGAVPPARGRRMTFIDDLLATHESNTSPLISDADATDFEDGAARTGERVVQQRSLFGEILDWMMVPLLLLWPLSVAITFVVARSIADAPYDRAMEDRLRVLAQQVRFPEGAPPVVILPNATRELIRNDGEDRAWFQFVAPGGEILLGERDLPPPALYDFPEPGLRKLRLDIYRGEEVRVAYVYVAPEAEEEESARPVLVQIAETQEKRTRLANEIIKGVILPQFLILPLALGLVWFGLTRGLGPLQSMQRRIRARRPDDLSPIDPKGVPQEISPLVETFNDLLSRLDQNIASQKRFIADAAHQMKTPLAGLRTQAELALRERDPEGVRRSLVQLARSSERAGHLISQLLSLARTENQRDHAVLEELDLNPLVRMVVTDWVDQAMARGIDIGFESDDVPAPIAGHPMLLRELIGNLIDNALRYTPRDGIVTARVRSRRNWVYIDVEDSGPGIPPTERRMVFERFYRVLGTQVDGSGLGLAIVREIAAQHDALVTIEDTKPGAEPPGTRFVIRFPKLRESGM